MIRPNSKGLGIMVSDFVDEQNGYLQLTDEEFVLDQQTQPSSREPMFYSSMVRAWMVIGQETSLFHRWNTVKIAEAKHDGCKHVCIFKVAATLQWRMMPWM